ncbi:tetratricopeptide repeat protein [Streptomyces hypolithicus]
MQAQHIGAITFHEAPSPVRIPGWPVPRQLPAPTRHFTNRRSELARLAALVDAETGAPDVVVLSGAGGIGKSATALHWAASLSSHYDGPQLHIDLRGDSTATALTSSEALDRFLRRLGIDQRWIPAEEDGRTDLFRSLTAGLRVLTILDNAHSVAQVLPLLPTGPGSLTLVTSRHRLARLIRERGAHHMELGPFASQDAEQLLARIAPGRDMTGAAAVARHCGGSPLALCVAAERMAVRTHLTWQQQRQDMEQGMKDHREPESDVQPLEGVADASYTDLTPEAARLYRLAALRAWPTISGPAAAALTGVPASQASELLEELAEVHLLDETAPGRYRFHELIRAHAEQRALREDGRAQSAAAVRRLLLWYVDSAAAADARVIPGRWHLGPAYARPAEPAAYSGPADALAWLGEEHENLAEAVRTAAEYGHDELTWQLCETLWALYLRQGFHAQWIATHRLGVAAAARCPDVPEALGRMHAQLGFGYLGAARFAEAETEFEAAAESDRRTGHRRGEATAVESLGLVRLQWGRYEEAADCFRRAQDLTDDPRARALLEHHLGRALSGLGAYDEATAMLERAGELMRRLPDPYNEARVLTSLGETALAAGRPEQAEAWLARAATRMAAEQAVVQQADIAELRARAANDPAAVRRFLTEALAHHERTGAPGAAVVRARLEALEVTGPTGS